MSTAGTTYKKRKEPPHEEDPDRHPGRLAANDMDEEEEGLVSASSPSANTITTDDIPVQPATKRPRLETRPALESLPPKVLQEVLGFVGSPKAIFTLATNIKAFHQALQPRPDIVVEAAFRESKKSRRVITSIVEQVQENQIHVPSATRLLRLLTLERCERGEECCGFNLETKIPAQLNDNSQKQLGIHHSLRICYDCCGFLMSDSIDKRCDWSFRNYIYATKVGSKIPRDTLLDCATGEAVGPCLLIKDFLQIHTTHVGTVSRYREAEGSKMDAAVAAVNALLENVPPQDQEGQANRELILESYDRLTSEEVLKKTMEAKRRQEKWEKRTEKGKAILQELKNHFGELVRTYPFFFECDFDETGSGKFQAQIIDKIIGPIVRKTSTKTSKQKLAAAIHSVVNTIIRLENQSFLGKKRFTFLDTGDITQAALSNYFGSFTMSRFFAKSQNDRPLYYSPDGRVFFWDYSSQGKPLDALCSLLLLDDYGYSSDDCNDDYREFFCSSMLQEMRIKPSNENRWKRYKKLAEAAYQDVGRHSTRWEQGAYAELKQDFLRKRLKFQECLSLIRLYKKHPATKIFLKQKDNDSTSFTRCMAVDSIFEMKAVDRFHLTNKSFDALLGMHRRFHTRMNSTQQNPSV